MQISEFIQIGSLFQLQITESLRSFSHVENHQSFLQQHISIHRLLQLSLMASKIKEEEFFLWQSMIPELRKNIQQCIQEVKDKPIRIREPECLDMKIERVKKVFEENVAFEEEQFLDVFAYFIEEKVNTTLLELADHFTTTFGRDQAFWTQKITQWATMLTFTSGLVIWNVTEFLRNFIHYRTSPLQRDFIYQWRQKVQAYLSSLQFLVRKIQRLKKTDNPYVLDEAYIKYHKQKMLYITFVNKLGLGKSNAEDSKASFHDEVTVTFQNKARAEKRLFNFPHATRTIDDMQSYVSNNSKMQPKKSVNTLEKYNFIKIKNSQEEEDNLSQMRREQMKQKREIFVKNLCQIGKNSQKSLTQLRDDLKDVQNKRRSELNRFKERFQATLEQTSMKLTAKKQKKQQQIQQASISQKQPIQQQHEIIIQPLYFQVIEQQSLQNPEYRRYPLSHAAFIHDPRDYYSFEGYPIGERDIEIADPFRLYPWVNYYINDREEYEDLMAISLGEVSIESDDSDEVVEGDEGSEEKRMMGWDADFIDYRAVVLADNLEWENLSPEDRIKFDQVVTDEKKRWVAEYRHPDGQDILSRFGCIPIYDCELPYPIQGSDQRRTKRKGMLSGERQLQMNEESRVSKQHEPMELMVENTVEMQKPTLMDKAQGLDSEETSFEDSNGYNFGQTISLNVQQRENTTKEQKLQSNLKSINEEIEI